MVLVSVPSLEVNRHMPPQGDRKNQPVEFDLIHSPSVCSVSFDSLAPGLLAPPGPTSGCSTSRLPRRSVMVNSAGFGLISTTVLLTEKKLR